MTAFLAQYLRTILFTGFTVICLYSHALGTTYYVDITSGDDANAGTSDLLAWKTIQHAANVAQAGDIVNVKEGTYDERVTFNISGTSGNKIVFQSSPRRTATVNGGFVINNPYICLKGFNITSSVSGRTAVEIAGNYTEVADNYIWNVRGRAIMGNQSGKPEGVYIADNHIYHCQMGIAVFGTDWLMENNEVERLYNYGAISDCDYARVFGNGNTFKRNHFHGSILSEVGSAHVDCFQTWCEGGANPLYWATNTTVDGNTCYDFHQAFMVEEGTCTTLVKGYTITNNIFAHTFTSGLGGYGINNKGVDDVTVINNTFADINYGGADMFQDISAALNAIIKNNIFFEVGRGYSFSSTSTSQGDYNLIYGAIDSSPYAPHNLVEVNPMLTDPTNDDYTPLPGSPACGAGVGGLDIGAIPCQPLSVPQAPHNKANALSCQACHNDQLPPPTARHTLCQNCHNGITAPLAQTHSNEVIHGGSGWSTVCLDCHDPHFHAALETNPDLFLVTGIIDTVTYNGDGTSSFTYSSAVIKAGWNLPPHADNADWGAKTSAGRGLILVVDTNAPSKTYEILSGTAAQISVDGLMISSLAGTNFGIMYGQLIRTSIDPDGDGIKAPVQVRLFDRSGINSFADGDTTADGICEVCHTQTNHFRDNGTVNENPGSGRDHTGGEDCTKTCHRHANGFGLDTP